MPDINGFPVPARRHRLETHVGGSRFIATLDRASSVEAARAVIESVREELPDATHHVYAFAVGHGATVTHGMSDAGEPSGTAGPPTLAVLHGSGLGDTCLVVSRYFGGQKLGTGGLVRAYSDAARRVIGEAPREPKVERCRVRFQVPYAAYELVARAVEDLDGEIDSADFTSEVTLTVRLPCAAVTELEAVCANLTSGSAEIERLD